MRLTVCDNCNNPEVPVNESIKIEGKTYCSPCLDATFPDKKVPEGQLIEKDLDPTVCSFCSKDFEDTELKKIAVYPVCADCEVNIKNRAFPKWVKAFLVGIIAIVVFSLFYNWKYFNAYANLKESNTYFAKGDFVKASALMQNVSHTVPEVEGISTYASYFNGVALLTQDKSADALKELTKCVGKMPPGNDLDFLLIQAKIGATFDTKNYPAFLDAAKEYLEYDNTQATGWAAVASAYACLYAENGKAEDKDMAFTYLKSARDIDSTSAEAKLYENTIRYRLASRKIITRAEFLKQFPNGWTP